MEGTPVWDQSGLHIVLAVEPLVRYLTSLQLPHSSSFVEWEWKLTHRRVAVKIMTKPGKFSWHIVSSP